MQNYTLQSHFLTTKRSAVRKHFSNNVNVNNVLIFLSKAASLFVRAQTRLLDQISLIMQLIFKTICSPVIKD